MASGLPVVAGDVGAIGTAVDETTGLLVPSGDAVALGGGTALLAAPPPPRAARAGAPAAGGRPAHAPSPSSSWSAAPTGSSPAWRRHMPEQQTVAYVLKGFPRMAELFIASEIHRLEEAGMRLRLYVIRPPDETERHPVVDR